MRAPLRNGEVESTSSTITNNKRAFSSTRFFFSIYLFFLPPRLFVTGPFFVFFFWHTNVFSQIILPWPIIIKYPTKKVSATKIWESIRRKMPTAYARPEPVMRPSTGIDRLKLEMCCIKKEKKERRDKSKAARFCYFNTRECAGRQMDIGPHNSSSSSSSSCITNESRSNLTWRRTGSLTRTLADGKRKKK